MADKVKSHPKRFVAIDANSLVHRAFHAFPDSLVTSKGVQVNAVYGFTSMFLRILADLGPKYLVCAFDLPKPTFRHTEFAEYKTHRKPTDETLIRQFPMVKDVLAAFNIPVLEKEGYEADDILGTLAYWSDHGKWESQNLEQVIVTGDKDLLQMVDKNTKVWLPRGSFKNVVMFDEAEVNDLFGFGPEFVVDFKALTGDNSDNIPGVKGIGKKTATMLIQEFGHLKNIYKNLDAITPRQKTLLVEGQESALLSRKLAQIVFDLDLEIELESCLMKDFDYDTVLRKFQEFEFRSLIKKIPESISGRNKVQIGIFETLSPSSGKKKSGASGEDESSQDEGDQEEGGKVEDLKDITCAKTGKKLKKIGLCFWGENKSCMVACDDGKTVRYFFSSDMEQDGSFRHLMKIFGGSDCDVITYGWESFCRYAYQLAVNKQDKLCLKNMACTRIFDISLAGYYLTTGLRDYSLKTLAFTYAAVILPDLDISKRPYCRMSVDTVLVVGKALQEKVSDHYDAVRFIDTEGGKSVVRNALGEVDFPLVLSSAEMTKNGITVDVQKLRKKGVVLDQEMEDLRKKMFEAVGHEFNLDSPKQLSDVLFNELGLPTQKKTKTGFSTGESVLRKLAGAHPCIEHILLYRKVSKLNNTYVRPLLELAGVSEDGRIHSTFRQTGTSTGRLSSQSPNLQNIPTRTDLGKEIKGMFIAPEGRTLVSADYSQIELRVMAHFSKDRLMLEDFAGGRDFHMATAVRILGKKDEKSVSKDERRIAKTINFGVLYGLSPFGLSEQLGISCEEAAEYINEYFEKYCGVKEYLDMTVSFVKEHGYLETMLGRRRYIPGVRSGNRIVRQAAEREAVNMPIQGTAADIMRIAMNKVYSWTVESGTNARLLLQIHDELVLEVDSGDAGDVAKEIKKIMESVTEWDVALDVDVKWGKSLNELK